MRDSFPFLVTLTLPVDAGAGERRIVLDGDDGSIQVYDATGDLRIQVGGSGFAEDDRISFYSGDADESSPGTLETSGGGRPALRLASPTVTNQSTRARIDLETPANDPALDRSRVQIYEDVGAGPDLLLTVSTLQIDEASNGPMGAATLVAGTVTVNNNQITANTRIFLSRQATGGTLGHLSITRVVGTSFTINSTSATDTSTVAWLLIQPF